jgi:hypothetical protein
MHQHKTDIQGAMNWVYEYHKELEAKFMNLYENKIPKFGEPVDTQLARYVDGMGTGCEPIISGASKQSDTLARRVLKLKKHAG